jgi:hypothetical protein
LAVFSGFCVAAVAVMWAYVWLRYGSETVKQRWQILDRAIAEASSRRHPYWNYGIWIIIAFALVVFFAYWQKPTH